MSRVAALKNQTFISIAVVVGIACAVYSNSLNNAFIGDDKSVIEESRLVKSWNNLPILFNRNYFLYSGESTYRPIATVTYLIDYSLWRLKPFGYHLSNVLLHAMNGALLLYLIRLIMGRPGIALITALFFVTHPVASEAVNSIGFREDLLVFLFLLISFIAYIRIWHQLTPRPRHLIVCIGSFLFGLFSKESALIIPLLFIASEVCFERHWKKLLTGKIPAYACLAMAALFYISIRFFLFRSSQVPVFKALPLYYRLITQGKVIVSYLATLMFPARLSADYSYQHALSFWEPAVTLSWLAIAAVLALSIRYVRRESAFTFGVWWFFIALIPVSNIIPIFVPVAERFLYMPLAGFALSFVIAGDRLASRLGRGARRYFILIAVLIIACYSCRTVIRNMDWSDELTLWSKTVASGRGSYRAYNNLGVSFHDIGKDDEALRSFREALEVFHGDCFIQTREEAKIYNNIGLANYYLGRREVAAAFYRKALATDPSYADAYNNMGIAYVRKGDYDSAIAYFKKALRIKPHFVKACNNLAVMYGETDKKEAAIEMFKKAVEINPSYAKAYNSLGLLYSDVREQEKAVASFKKATEADPRLAEGYTNLGKAYYGLKRNREAIDAFRTSLRIDPDNPDVSCCLGVVYSDLGDYEDAVRWYTRSIEIDPRYAKAYNNLGVIYKKLKKRKEALACYEKAVALDPKYAQAHANLAAELYYEKQYDQAIEHADQAASLGYRVDPELEKLLEPHRQK